MKKNIIRNPAPTHKAALYNPYLDTLGGGEKFILSILRVLEENSFEISIYWDKTIAMDFRRKFDLGFKNLIFKPNIFKNKSFIEKLKELSQYECFFYVSDGSYFFSSAKKNFVYAMVPKKSIYPDKIINRFKTKNFTFFTHSHYVQNHLKDWGIDSKVIYPFIPLPKNINLHNKKNIILSVGRFFPQLHSKRQDIVIKAFNDLQKLPKFKNYSLILAGGVHDKDRSYFEKIKTMAENNPAIVLKPNISQKELGKLYSLSEYYWHFAGYDADDIKHPELVEHLGMTPLEAMSYGTIPFCYNAGGPKEIIKPDSNGFLFLTIEELITQMSGIALNPERKKFYQENAIEYIKKNFNYDLFEKSVFQLINK